MKKIIAVLAVLFALGITANAEEELIYPGEVVNTPRLAVMDSGIQTFALSGWNSTERQLYNTIQNGLINHASQIDILEYDVEFPKNPDSTATISYQRLMDIICTIAYNNPEYGYLRTGHGGLDGVRYTDSGKVRTSILYPLYLDGYDEKAYKESIDYAMSKMQLSKMDVAGDVELSTRNKLLAIHDYLTDNCYYSNINKTPALDAEGKPVTDENGNQLYYTFYEDSDFTPFGTLVEGDSVCQGYALAFKLFCDRLGIECGYAVTSDHIWNVVRLGDYYYHIDVTWDDPVQYLRSSDGTRERVHWEKHDNFLLTDEENAAVGHDEEWESDKPPCGAPTSLNATLGYAGYLDPLVWRGDSFWCKETVRLVGNALYKVENYYKMTDKTMQEVEKAEFLPEKRLECEISPAYNGKCAIDGTAGESVDLYAAAYDGDGRLISVLPRQDITFDARGRAVATISPNVKLMLFADDDVKPMAYAIEE